MAIPWTHRDSRPRSQAEQDQEETFNARRKLKLTYDGPSDLHRRLEHYQEMITRFVNNPKLRWELDMADMLAPSEQKRRNESYRRTVEKGLYKKKVQKEELRRQAAEKRHELIWRKPRFFSHLDKVVSEPVEDWSEWHNREKPVAPPPTPPAEPPVVAKRLPWVFDSAEFKRQMEKIYQEYHIDVHDLELKQAWKASLESLALTRMHLIP